MKIFGRKKEVEKSEIDVLIDFLKNTANLTYVPELYKDELEKALLFIKNEDSNYVLAEQKDKFSEIKSAAKYAIEKGVGFRVHVADDVNYKGKVGVSSILKKLYELDGKRVRIGSLDLDATEEGLESLSLKMYKEDAAMLFGPKRVEEAKEVIEPVKIELSVITPKVITPPKEEKKEKTIAEQIEEDLKKYETIKRALEKK
jgi:hypothetical protein